MVESNVTLEAQTILTALNGTSDITVNNNKVTVSEPQLIAGVVRFLFGDSVL